MNKYITQLADLQWLNVIIAGVIVAVVYYFTLYDDGKSLTTAIEQGGVRLEEAKRQLAQTEKAMQNANRFEREVKETAKQFESIVDYMPLSLSASDMNSIITKNAQFAGVRVSKLEPKGPDMTAGFYQTTRMAMTLEGSFAQIVTFLANLSRAPNLLTLEGTKLKAKNSNENPPVLTFEATLVGYRYVKEDPNKIAADGKGQPGKPAAQATGKPPAVQGGE